jgi:hypothetical protein
MIGTMASSYAYYDTLGDEVTTSGCYGLEGVVSLTMSQFEVEL